MVTTADRVHHQHPQRRSARVLIVEDHCLIAQGLELALGREGMDVLSGDSGSAEAILEAARTHRPDVVLLDLNLGESVGDGLVLIEPLRALGGAVIVVTAVTDRAHLGACVEAGATAVVSKSQPFEHVLRTISLVLEGLPAQSLSIHLELLEELRRQRQADRERLAPFDRLTRRERHVLAALVDGGTAEGIAAASYVSLATVRSQIQSVLRKLGVNSQVAAVAEAHRAGWSPPISSQRVS